VSEGLLQFLSRPIVVLVGVIGAVASIIAIPLAIYLYRRGDKRLGLAYKIHPVRTQIVRAGAASRLSVIHDGRKIKTDITAVHLAIWNQGRESIRQGDMLRPLIIQTEDHAPILEASIRMATRDVIGLKLDESKCDLGQLDVSWDILEKDDGGIVQIIYEGPPELQIMAYGIPEGQRGLMSINHIRPFPLRGVIMSKPFFQRLQMEPVHVTFEDIVPAASTPARVRQRAVYKDLIQQWPRFLTEAVRDGVESQLRP
jgi:hypothetical protein